MRNIATLILLSLLCTYALSQKSITGHILSAENNHAIIGASVFISNTSKGTIAGNNGEFLITGVPEGKHELIVSSVGYETFVRSFSEEELPFSVEVKLKLKIQELEGVTVIPFEKDGWKKWGQTFIESFIGTDENAENCELINHEVIRFRFSQKNNKLIAVALEPLKIRNKRLRYHISYQLENFEMDFENHRMVFLGYALFKEMKGAKKKRIKERAKTYSGSMLHFIRSISGNILLEEGFEIRRMQKVSNIEKIRIKEIYKLVPKRKIDDKTKQVSTVMEYNNERFSKDSVEYYEKVLRQGDSVEVYGSSLLTADSIAGIDSNRIKYFVFPDYLSIIYKNTKEDYRYLIYSMQTDRDLSYPHSFLRLSGRGFVIMEGSGNYYNPLDLLSTGYWAWKEKISSLLPYDYKPTE